MHICWNKRLQRRTRQSWCLVHFLLSRIWNPGKSTSGLALSMTIYSKRAFKTRFQYRLLSKLGTKIWHARLPQPTGEEYHHRLAFPGHHKQAAASVHKPTLRITKSKSNSNPSGFLYLDRVTCPSRSAPPSQVSNKVGRTNKHSYQFMWPFSSFNIQREVAPSAILRIRRRGRLAAGVVRTEIKAAANNDQYQQSQSRRTSPSLHHSLRCDFVGPVFKY